MIKLGMIFAAILLFMLVFWLISMLPGRKHRTEMKELREYDYAHRGLHNIKKGIPENSIAAFQKAVEMGYGMELDLHLTRDGRLAVMHDDSLKRTCGVNAMVHEKTMAELKKYLLEGTQERVPEFQEVLKLVKGRTPLVVEIKTVKGNYREICRAVCRELDHYEGLYCIESFDPRVVLLLRRYRPDMVRGQLAEHFRRHGTMVNPIGDFLLHNLFSNVITRPDFISYQHLDRKTPSLRLCRKLYGVSEFNWTVKDQETHRKIREDGGIVIFEDFLPHRKDSRKNDQDRKGSRKDGQDAKGRKCI
ncbi:MAG: glycerophosphodiester phosphodiesterase family protein [Candidatus Limivivens sp.]|nr:glycerophosphodiester phosphodiesterase family protein [Candidatus Limivivens sp.]